MHISWKERVIPDLTPFEWIIVGLVAVGALALVVIAISSIRRTKKVDRMEIDLKSVLAGRDEVRAIAADVGDIKGTQSAITGHLAQLDHSTAQMAQSPGTLEALLDLVRSPLFLGVVVRAISEQTGQRELESGLPAISAPPAPSVGSGSKGEGFAADRAGWFTDATGDNGNGDPEAMPARQRFATDRGRREAPADPAAVIAATRAGSNGATSVTAIAVPVGGLGSVPADPPPAAADEEPVNDALAGPTTKLPTVGEQASEHDTKNGEEGGDAALDITAIVSTDGTDGLGLFQQALAARRNTGEQQTLGGQTGSAEEGAETDKDGVDAPAVTDPVPAEAAQ